MMSSSTATTAGAGLFFVNPNCLLIQPCRVHNLCDKMEGNTRRYMRIVAEVVDSLLDLMPAADDVPDRDVFDVMRSQRMATIRQRWNERDDFIAEYPFVILY